MEVIDGFLGKWNVRDSDGPVIFTMATSLTGGSKLTADAAKKLGKPWLAPFGW